MKARYLIALCVALSFILLFVHIVFIGAAIQLVSPLLQNAGNVQGLAIVRIVSVLASIAVAFLFAFPVGYAAGRHGAI